MNGLALVHIIHQTALRLLLASCGAAIAVRKGGYVCCNGQTAVFLKQKGACQSSQHAQEELAHAPIINATSGADQRHAVMFHLL